MVEYLLIDTKRYGGTEMVACKRVSLAEAAEEMDLDPAEIEWSIEEYNRCDCERFILIKEEYNADHPA